MENEKLSRFMEVYTDTLRDAVINYPDEYRWPIEEVPLVAERMRLALLRKSYSKDGRAIKATCKKLGIAHTYKAIDDFLDRKDQ